MELLTGILSAFGLSASAGLNAYIPLLVIGSLAHYTDLVKLDRPWDTLANPWILILLGILVIIEFLADKFPAVNHINDLIQTVIRPIAGAIVFAASAKVFTDIHPVISMACGLLIAGTVHVIKAGAVRPAVTATTGGTANVPVSILEDVISTTLSILAVVIPVLIGCLLVLVTAFIIWWLWRRANARQRV
jgi:ABC-type Co2+ transport system permease subunit